MKSVKRFFQAAGLLTAAVAALSISMAAQQEVNPDHFDDQPAVAKASKSAPKPARPAAAKKPSPVAQSTVKAKSAPAQKPSAVVAAKETPVVTASNQR
jgi:hypothetical protein